MTDPAAAPAADLSSRGGRPVLVVDGAAAGILAGRREQAMGARHRLGQRIPLAAYELLTAARAAHAYTSLRLEVPRAEPLLGNGSSESALWASTEDAATVLHIGERAVRKRLAAGTLHGRKRHGQWEVRLDPDKVDTAP